MLVSLHDRRFIVRPGPLLVEKTDRAVLLARVDRLAVNVFGDFAKAHRWLRKP
ncbi:hypothetical protein [Bradyrhizobium japonicum]|uniref:hypothetical protein n=1 Tax=Bradyrhizobium japonicum TaxID=375 RepID=UPI0004B4A7F1|nr:hypothetical protein [Bradyrhizobium japonicum]